LKSQKKSARFAAKHQYTRLALILGKKLTSQIKVVKVGATRFWGVGAF